MKRFRTVLAAALLMAPLALTAQSLDVKVGVFMPTLNSDLWAVNIENLAFAKRDMVDGMVAVGYEMFLNRNVAVGLEVGSYSRSRHSQYRDYEHADGAPIFQSISLKVTPIEAVFTFYLLGHRRPFSPYLAVAGGVYAWTYEQWGEFINFEDDPLTLQEGSAFTQTVSPGFSARFGFLFRPSRGLGLSIEGKYQYLKGTLSSDFEDFEPLDMGGPAIMAGLHIFLD